MGSAGEQANIRRGWLAAGAAVVGTVMLAGCSTFDPIGGVVTKTPTPSATSTPTPSATPSASPTPTSTPTPAPQASKPYEVACVKLLTAQQAYDYNPNFGLTDGYHARSAGAGIVSAERGTVCGWTNQTSGSTFEVAAATPAAATFASLRAEAAASGASTTVSGSDAYYLTGTVGELRVFTSRGLLVVIASDDFTNAGDATELAAIVLGNL